MTSPNFAPDQANVSTPIWPHITLASGSPRRRALLAAAGVPVTVRPSHADESWPQNEGLQTALLSVTRRKLAALPDNTLWALAADTIVALDKSVLGKPADAQAACGMLRRLSGRTHSVMTGFILVHCDADGARYEHVQVVTTKVRFRALDEAEIGRYVATGDGLDKAGAYGIQSLGGFLVDTVLGSYTNIVGLPLTEVLAAVERLRSRL